MQKKVLVLKGGFSAEREVSLVTGKNVANALKNKGYNVVEYDLQNGFDFVEVLKKYKPDVVFNALHGNFGEDGEIQGFLDVLQIPYTHSGVKSSVLGMDKVLTKNIAIENGVKVAKSESISVKDFKEGKYSIKMPFVVKPICDGSSVGVFIVKNEEDKANVKYDCEDKRLMIEEFIEGRELTVSVLDGKALGVTELVSSNDFYDYNAKYTDGVTKHIFPAEMVQSDYELAKKYAEVMHRALGCNVVSRCDFRYNEKDGLVLLEINTNPGMTALSLVPEQAKFLDISYEDLCVRLVENAYCRKLDS